MGNLWRLLKQPKTRATWTVEEYFKDSSIRYYSYGRHALCSALRMCGVQDGDKVLVPAFICRDLLSAIRECGAEPIYYQVNRELKLKERAEDLPEATAVVAVNFFGFPQLLQEFERYCERTGAKLIEDNAHGLFSRDERGRLLGTRAELGVLSLRKTVEMINGAALVCNSEGLKGALPKQLELKDLSPPVSLKLRRFLKKVRPWTGPLPLQAIAQLTRTIRRWRTGYAVPPSLPDAEWITPKPANPCNDIKVLADIDPEKEVERRRKLYQKVEMLLKPLNVESVFPVLPEGTAPYMYPFYCEADKIKKVLDRLQLCGLEAFPWPELPDIWKDRAPVYYHNVWGVLFI